MTMNEEHRYVDDMGVEWKRVWTVPRAAIDCKIDPFSEKDFAAKTANKKGETLGDLFDRSKEAAQKRVDVAGHDQVKEQKYRSYEQKNGKKCPAELKEMASKPIKVKFPKR